MLFAMGALEGGACALLPQQMTYRGGLPMCLCAYKLLLVIMAPNGILTRFSLVPQQTGISKVYVSLVFPQTLFGGEGCWGPVVPTYTVFHILVH
jgi:hypothetical protein